MEKTKFFAVIIAAITFTSLSSAYVGTAPGVVDMGALEPGKTYEGYFYVLTDRDQPFIVRPKFTPAHTSILTEGKKKQYDFDPSEASDQDISSWVSFEQDAYTVDPSNVIVIELANGAVARANKKIPFQVTVPPKPRAEPGYHAGAINLNPRFSASGSGTASVSTVALTQPLFVFRVPGKAIRDLKILGVNGIRTQNDRVRFDFLMKNNGTVTTQIQRSETVIYNQVGNKTGELVTGGYKLAPGETKIVKTYWKSDDIEPGEYRVEGQMSYVTGQAYVDDTINVSEMFEIRSPPGQEGEKPLLPWWLVVMILVLLGAVMYYFELDPVWIVAFIGAAGISVYIYSTGLPNYLIGLLLLLTMLLLIYGSA